MFFTWNSRVISNRSEEQTVNFGFIFAPDAKRITLENIATTERKTSREYTDS